MNTFKEFLDEKISWENYGSWKVSENTGNFEVKYKKTKDKYDVIIVVSSKKGNPLYNDFEKITRKYNSSVSSRGEEHTFKLFGLSEKEFKNLMNNIE